jgi:ATP-binding cassette subfamily F protein 3
VRLKDVRFGYEQRDVFARVGAEVQRGDKVAIVGANGAGKTTLLRVLAGQLAPRSGERETWPHTRMAYFAQHAAETLDGELTVLEALEAVAPPDWRPRLRSLLGTFLFSGDDVFKLCRVLSGGERQRVALARILMEPANLLLLDEPTHHLDLAGKEVLEDALDQFEGAIVVVTHDRSLMARLATRVLEVNDGRVVLYPGGYEDYEAAHLARAAGTGNGSRGGEAEEPRPAAAAPDRPRASGRGTKAATRDADRAARPEPPRPPGRTEREDREARAARRAREREVARIENDIQTRETRAHELETLLADPEVYHDGARARGLVGEYERLRAELESLWQRLGEL